MFFILGFNVFYIYGLQHSHSQFDVEYCLDVTETRHKKVLMCSQNVSILSRVTSSVFTVSESGTTAPARSVLESRGKEHRQWHEPNIIA